MIDIGQDAAGLRSLLLRPHILKVRIQLMDLDGNHKKDLSPYFMSGQVTIDATAEITRALDLSLIDPFGKLNFQPDSPSSTSVFISDVIKVWYVVRDPVSGEVYSIPVFTGPLDSVSRTDMFLDVKCVGKERLALDNVWNGRTFKKGQRKTDIIRRILTEMVGEKNISIPARKAKLARDLKINKDDLPWKVASSLAASMNCQLFYDGRGVAQMRARSRKPVMNLNERWVSSVPQVSYDLSTVWNSVRVIGSKPKKAKTRVTGQAVSHRTDALSPWRLGRGGVPRFIPYTVEDDSLRTDKECETLAKHLLDAGLKSGVSFSVDGIVDPRLEENDMVHVAVGDVSCTAPLKALTIPLTAGDDGAYGYNRRITPKGGSRILKRRKNKHNRHPGHRQHKGPRKADGKVG